MGRELAEPPYVIGHTSDEIDRLVEQSHQFRMQSELLLRAAGLARGMRVLDVGCGPGDLSILAAQLVGAKDGRGEVVGIDNAAAAVETARSRALQEGLSNISFELCDVTQLDPAPDASGCLRALVRYAKPDAIISFQELDTRSAESDPPGALFGRSAQRLQALDANVFRHIAETTRTLLPLITRAGIATVTEVDIATIEARLRDEALETTSTLTNVALVGAWTRLTPRSTIKAQ